MKYIISTIKFFTILGLTTIILLGCMRKQPEPVAKKTEPSDPNYYIGPGGLAIDLREVKKDGKKKSYYLQANSLPAQDRQKYLKECLP